MTNEMPQDLIVFLHSATQGFHERGFPGIPIEALGDIVRDTGRTDWIPYLDGLIEVMVESNLMHFGTRR